MAEDFDSYKSKLPEVSALLDRIKTETKDQLKALKYVSEADQAINAAKSVLTDDYFKTANLKELMQISNPWSAVDVKILKDSRVKKHLDVFLTGKKDKYGRFARQIWRTHMVGFLLEKLSAAGRTDISLPHAVERIMAGQIVGEEEDEPKEVVKKASWLDSILNSNQAEVIKGMESSKISCKPSEIPANFSGRLVWKVKVVVGGAFLEIPQALASEFKFKHMWLDSDRIYGQMENGCKGNLVIIELEPPSRKSPPAPPPPEPPPPSPPAPRKPPPPPEPLAPEPVRPPPSPVVPFPPPEETTPSPVRPPPSPVVPFPAPEPTPAPPVRPPPSPVVPFPKPAAPEPVRPQPSPAVPFPGPAPSPSSQHRPSPSPVVPFPGEELHRVEKSSFLLKEIPPPDVGYKEVVKEVSPGKISLADLFSDEGRAQRTLRFQNIADAITQRYSIPKNYLLAMIMQESCGNPVLPNLSRDAGLGLIHMQPLLASQYGLDLITDSKKLRDFFQGRKIEEAIERENADLKNLLKYDDRFHPIKNIDAAARMLRDWYQETGSWDGALRRYAGRKEYPGKIRRFASLLDSPQFKIKIARDFERKNPEKSLNDYLLAFNNMNRNYGLDEYLKLPPIH